MKITHLGPLVVHGVYQRHSGHDVGDVQCQGTTAVAGARSGRRPKTKRAASREPDSRAPPLHYPSGPVAGSDCVVYCREFPCLNDRIHALHGECLRGVPGAEFEIDRHLMGCVVFENLATPPRANDESIAGPGGIFINISCLCGDPSHTMRLYKASLQCGFEAHRQSRRMGNTRNPVKQCCGETVVNIPVEAFVTLPCNTVQYGLLPDLGKFLHAVLQKRFFSSVARRCTAKFAAWSSTGLSKEPGRGKQFPSSTKGGVSDNTLYQPRAAVVLQRMDGVCAALLQEGIPCLRRAKRNNKLVDPGCIHHHELVACINTMHGTLLKLYPLGAKRPIFTARKRILQRLGEIMMLPASDITAFLVQHAALVKLCFMEYTLNVMVSHMPVERQLLMGNPLELECSPVQMWCASMGRSVGLPVFHNGSASMYESVCVAMCDLFRQETVLTGDESWGRMNEIASSSIERCVRICKFRVTRVREPMMRISVAQDAFMARALEMRYMAGDVLGLRCMHPDAAPDEIVFASMIQKSIMRFPLPRNIVEQQRESLWALHSKCFLTMEAHQFLNICVLCVMNGRMGKTKMRMCSSTGEYSCTTCPAGTVVCVRMLGIVLKICNTNFYMCPCCTRISAWTADGMDLCPAISHVLDSACVSWKKDMEHDRIQRQRAIACIATACNGTNQAHPLAQYGATGEFGCRCVCGPNPRVDLLAQSECRFEADVGNYVQSCVGTTERPPQCIVCDTRHISLVNTVVVPDSQRRVMCRAHFCSKHVIPDFLLRNVFDEADLRMAIDMHRNMVASRRVGRR